MRKDMRQKGFTLVELAIVMVIIGLLIGAVLRGQAMIEDARVKRVINDINGISAAYYTYLDRYGAFPGDDPAGSRFAGVADGNANGDIDNGENPPAGESQAAWQAMRAAGLIAGNPADTGAAALPLHAYGSTILIGDLPMAGLGNTNRLRFNNLPPNVAGMIDERLDDGQNGTGNIQAAQTYAGPGNANLDYAL